ncbi:RNA-binding protein [Schizosaccharomyces japonicus yFS275]|uniref:RNA-binding protein n=1 Tax=Schizosaccharomyces japonicus (strain yFS275 / FY16936) TaxID=402676 RepID=B6JY52_SCHJY|nr:RNA-binding protein [Schizosaccharomyces japonicus yFS275]EEB06470.2 RNA-binding protein [Schizosaccharomyces japonicus yFS275]
MEENYSSFSVNGRNVIVKFSKEQRDPAEGWSCQNCGSKNYPRREFCFHCRVHRNQASLSLLPLRNERKGDRDVSEDIPSVYMLIRNLDTSLNATVILKGLEKLLIPVQRLLMVRYKSNDAFCGFVFVEYANVDETAKALRNARTMPNRGFTISSRRVSATYIHPGVFVPAYGPSQQWMFPTRTGHVVYWDPELYCEVTIPEGISPDQFLPVAIPEQKSKKEKRKRDLSKLNPGPTKKVSMTLARWQGAQEELRDNIPSLTEEDEYVLMQYAWKSALVCVLCERRFRSWGHMVKHVTQSFMHNSKLHSKEAIDKATDLMRQVRQIEQEGGYRDRATERRRIVAFGGDQDDDNLTAHEPLGATTMPSTSRTEEDEGPTAYLPGSGLGHREGRFRMNMTPVGRVKDRARNLYFSSTSNNSSNST